MTSDVTPHQLVTNHAPRGNVRPDELVLDDVARQLAVHPEVEARDVEVVCNHGVVTVRGSVPLRNHKLHIEALVALTFGVRDVDVSALEVHRELEPPDPDALLAESEGTSHAGLAARPPAEDVAAAEGAEDELYEDKPPEV